MISLKRFLLANVIIINNKKQKLNQKSDNDNKNDVTRRESRNKIFKIFNIIASQRDIQFAKNQNKKIFTQKIMITVFISMIKQRDSEHERIVFINNDFKEFKFCFYRKTEKTKLISHFWIDFFQ